MDINHEENWSEETREVKHDDDEIEEEENKKDLGRERRIETLENRLEINEKKTRKRKRKDKV